MALTRPLKEGSVTTYQEKVSLGFKDILASEADGDHDTMYAAWNGALGGDLTGTLPNPTVVAAAKSKWTVSGATLTPTDATKTVSVPGGAAGAGGGALVLGSNTPKGRIQLNNTIANPVLTLSANRDTIAGTTDDATKPAWQIFLNTNADNATIGRFPPSSSTVTNLLLLDNAGSLTTTGADGASPVISCLGVGNVQGPIFSGRGARGTGAAPAPSLTNDTLAQVQGQGCHTAGQNFSTQGMIRFVAAENWSSTARGTSVFLYSTPVGSTSLGGVYLIFDGGGNLTITGSIGQKASGTTWQNPSDPRLKEDLAPYAAGLAEILQLKPITYRLKAQPDAPLCYGFDAERVRDVFPECVSETRMKLDPADEEETEGVLTFDMLPILVAVINAIKELANGRS